MVQVALTDLETYMETSLDTLSNVTTVGTIGAGVWQGTAVASAYIAADAITGAKIADDAIDSEHYTDGSIDVAHMAANSIDSAQYVDGSIDVAHMAANSVDSAQYVDGSIDLAHMSADSIDSTQYVDGSIDNAHLADDAVDSDEIAAGAIDLAHMSVNSIDSDQYVDGSIDAAHIASNAVTSAKLDTNIAVGGTLGVTGVTTLATHLVMGDNDIIKLGASADLQIQHDASNSYITDAGTGALKLRGSVINIDNADSSKGMATFTDGGSVDLFYNDSKKLETVTGGIEITGNMESDNITIAGAQGSDGQLLTSTGSGVGWEDAPSSGISMGKAIAAAMVFG
jgi:hypothetical protein